MHMGFIHGDDTCMLFKCIWPYTYQVWHVGRTLQCSNWKTIFTVFKYYFVNQWEIWKLEACFQNRCLFTDWQRFSILRFHSNWNTWASKFSIVFTNLNTWVKIFCVKFQKYPFETEHKISFSYIEICEANWEVNLKALLSLFTYVNQQFQRCWM